ncbi:hypothetical protein MNV_1820015 [Candidatus Methanoperedens nitroreducens]|uniref:Uncharacterized protein n=1 Tax=Candidatus Methanoperedens nitratireducens TaxID=1392998 RepID=A0A284VMI8_9EURY|nr:hypothetical protein MNV_1820015 [Candidatus Methanoperedens nitroreducens]
MVGMLSRGIFHLIIHTNITGDIPVYSYKPLYTGLVHRTGYTVTERCGKLMLPKGDKIPKSGYYHINQAHINS